MECTIKDVNVYYEVHGEGTPILMIHGWGPAHRLMKGCMEPVFEIMDTAWKRVYIDLPGMGKTKGASWINSPDLLLEILLAFIDAVISNRNFLIAGQSYGAYLAGGIMAKRQAAVDGLLLICPAAMNESVENDSQYQVLERTDSIVDSLSEEDKKYFLREGIVTVQNKRVWERFEKEVLPGLKCADYPFLRNFVSPGIFSFDVFEKPYEKPTLIFAGRQDSMVGFRGIWQSFEKFTRASFVLLDKAAHSLQIEQDVLFTAMVREWLDRVFAEPT